MKTIAVIKGLTTALCCMALLGCGGSSDDDAPAAAQPRPLVSVGTITGFGSVIVNGVRFDDLGAAVTINDEPATKAQLRVGMVVAVDGSVKACANADVALCEGTATSIRFRNNIEGPITALNRLANTVRVMEREIVVDDGTVFEGNTAPGLEGLAVGDVVAVSGLAEQTRLRARLMHRVGAFVDGTTPLMLHGVVANVDNVAGTCTVDGVQVRFQGRQASDLPVGGVTNGQYVSVQGKGYGNGVMAVHRIQVRERVSHPDSSLIELEGYISGFVSVADFLVDGQQVDASSAVFRNGTLVDLKDGVKVEVEGTMAGAVLVASKVIFRPEASVLVVAPVQGKDAGASVLVLLGQSVTTTPLTQFVDKSAAATLPISAIGYADLLLNDRLDVRAYKDTAGHLVAIRVERTDPDPLLVARGPVDAKVPVERLTLFGIDVATGAATRYLDPMGDPTTAAEFYDLVQLLPAIPTVVRAQGVASTTSSKTIDATRNTSASGEVAIVD